LIPRARTKALRLHEGSTSEATEQAWSP